MDWKLLDQLKTKLETAENFSDVWEFFLDHFGENEEFMKLGRPLENAGLNRLFEETLRTSGKQHLQKSHVRISQMMLLDLPEHHFLHGTARVDGAVAGFLYFSDVGIGMIALARAGSSWAHFSRFLLSLIDKDQIRPRFTNGKRGEGPGAEGPGR